MTKALLIIDMWDNHWCPTAKRQADRIAPGINKLKKDYNIVIHAPDGYKMIEKYSSTRNWINNISISEKYTTDINKITNLECPIYSGVGSCPESFAKMEQNWTGIHKNISINDDDKISNNPNKIFTVLDQYDEIHICGLHLNMCILKNSYGIINLLKYGFDVKLLKDYTDVLYNPARWPYVSIETAKLIMLEYVEKNYCAII